MEVCHRTLCISWKDKVPNAEVVSHRPNNLVDSAQTLRMAGSYSSYHRIPKDILYRELANGKSDTDWPHLSYRDVCKRDMKALVINSDRW